MDLQYVEAYKDGALGIIRVNRESKRNALNKETIIELQQALTLWEKHPGVEVIIITGSGNQSFIAGADIGQLAEKNAIDGLRSDLSTLCFNIERCEKVTIAMINGYAFGGGLEIALACDIRIASENAKFALPELNLGIIPGAGGTQRLARIIGKGRAIEMILTGDVISSEKAERIGLISEVVPYESLWESVLNLVKKIITKGPLARQLVMQVIHEGYDAPMATALMLEKFAQTILLETKDKEEGLQAFLEKRTPEFYGS